MRTNLKQYVAWRGIPLDNGKTKKLLINPHTGRAASSVDPTTWGSYDDVTTFIASHADHHLGFVFTADDPYFFIDIDDCIDAAGNWNTISKQIYSRFPDAYVEYSQSGRGLHIIGIGKRPVGYKNKSDYGYDIYTEKRFVALCPDTVISGDHNKYDHTAQLTAVTTEHFESRDANAVDWTDYAVDGYNFSGSDEDLVNLALNAKSLRVRFGDAVSFKSLWTHDDDELTKHFPNDQDAGIPDESRVESALATHLAFWTGKNAARIERIITDLWPHCRDKWLNRPAYRESTITGALKTCRETYQTTPESVREFVKTVPTATAGITPQWCHGVEPGGDYGKDHTPNAVSFLRDWYGDGAYLICNENDLYRYDGKIWNVVTEETLRGEITRAMLAASPQSSWIDGTLKIVKQLCTRNDLNVGDWPGHNTESLIVYQNGILDLDEMKFYGHEPAYLCVNIMPYEYRNTVTCPQWSSFLNEVFEGDQQRINLLQEYMGYCLVRSYSFHKALMMIGLRRSGKGTIGRIIRKLVGAHNYSAAGLEDLANDATLDALRTKTVAFDGDAHDVSPGSRGQVLTRFKKITGNDAIQFGRKYKSSMDTTLPTRFIIAANNMLNFSDDSGAMTGRLCILPFNLSWQGREDLSLGDRLETEIQGIANWAIEGLVRLRSNGRFTEPDISMEEIEQLTESYSPLLAFAKECLQFGATEQVGSQTLFQAYSLWCRQNGRKPGHVGSLSNHMKNTFRGQIQHGKITLGDGTRVSGFKGVGVVSMASSPSNVVPMTR